MQFDKITTYLTSVLIGLTLHKFQNLIEMKSLQEGVNYYGEVHTSFWNCIIHTLFMPFTMLGMFIWIPALFDMSRYDAKHLRYNCVIVYILHYSYINIWVTIFVCVLYYYPLVYSEKLYTDKLSLYLGLSISCCALSIQESIGHYIGGDDASRFEAIPNAVFYAPYFSVGHFFK